MNGIKKLLGLVVFIINLLLIAVGLKHDNAKRKKPKNDKCDK